MMKKDIFMRKKIKICLLFLMMIITTSSYSQIRDIKSDSIRLDNIDNTLRNYGKQNVISDKLTLLSIGIVVVGSIFNMKPEPMLVATSLCSLANLAISWKADINLSKHKFEKKIIL